jgi:hypothetical protein
MNVGILHHGLTRDCPTPLPNGACPGHEIEIARLARLEESARSLLRYMETAYPDPWLSPTLWSHVRELKHQLGDLTCAICDEKILPSQEMYCTEKAEHHRRCYDDAAGDEIQEARETDFGQYDYEDEESAVPRRGES